MILKKSVLAGIFISFGCVIYTAIGGYMGAFLFAFGLSAVLVFEASLYTGKVGYVKWSKKDISDIFLIILGNFLGSLIVALICKLGNYTLTQPKIILNSALFAKALLCGMIMYIVVHGIRIKGNYILLLGIPLFILSGMSHSVALMFYLLYFDYGAIWIELSILLIALIGNCIGAKIIYYLT